MRSRWRRLGRSRCPRKGPRHAEEESEVHRPLVAGDDSHWRVFNASAAGGVVDPDLRDLLHYVATGRPDGALSREIDSFVEEYNRDREWVTEVLTYEQDTEMRCRRAEARGIEQGMDRLGALVGLLLDAGRLDDARRVSEDAAYRDEMLAEFGLEASE